MRLCPPVLMRITTTTTTTIIIIIITATTTTLTPMPLTPIVTDKTPTAFDVA
jgi:hypothetical protein